MINRKYLKKMISLAIIGTFLWYMSPGLYAQSEEECVEQFRMAKTRYLNGQYVNAKTRLERVIAIILEKKIDRSDILGKCYLLLGAIYEKEDLPEMAKESYHRAKDEYGMMKVEDVNLNSLKLYRDIVIGTIEKQGAKKKKKFPWLLVAGGVVVVGVLTYFLLRKPKNKTLTVELDEGVEGSPATGTYSYKKGTLVEYSYQARSGYTQLQVTLDGQPAASSGQVSMDRDHLIAASAAANTVEILTDKDWVDIPEGGTASFNVKLSAQPPQEITVTAARLSGDSDIGVFYGGNLTFTPLNWNTYQAVGLQAAQDTDAENGTAIIGLRAAGLPDKNITAVELDNESLHFVTDREKVSIREGNSEIFRVRLSAQPSADITASVTRSSGDNDISVRTGTVLTFTPTNWNMNQTVTLEAGQDMDTVNGEATIRISSVGVAPKEIIAEEIDDDILQFDIAADELPIEITEGDTKSFQVKLTGQPQSSVTAEVSRISGDTDITVQSGSSLTFTPDNWDLYQTVTLAAAQDDDIQHGTATIRISAAGLANRDIEAREKDDDALRFVTDVEEVTVIEEGSATFQVRLSAAPPAEVYAVVSRTDGDTDISVRSGTALTFTPSDWNTLQTVTLEAKKDEDMENGEALIKVQAAGVSSAAVVAKEADNGPGTKPEVSIKTPKDREVVFDDVTIELVARDDFGIQKIEFYIDNILTYTDTDYPYTYVWSTGEVPGGPHQIKVIAYDAIGQTDSDEISVTVEDRTPTVEIVEPPSGATVSGTINVTVKGQDTKGVKRLLLYIDEQEAGSWEGTPQTILQHTFSLDTTAYSNASHILKAVAVDTADQPSQPAEIVIEIRN